MGKKGKALKGFVIFLIFIFICGIISRGIYAEQMPRITTAKISSRELNHTVNGEGIVEAKQEKPFLLPAGLLVDSVNVRKGQKVEEGDVLFTLDVEEISKQYQEKQEELKLAKTRLSDYNAGVAEGEKNHQTALNRAREDYNNANSSSAEAVNAAQGAYQSAKDALNNFPSKKDYIKQAKKKDDTYQKLKKEAKKKDATEEDKAAFEDYEAQLESGLESRYQEEKQALKDSVAQREADLSSARKDQGERLQAAGRALEDAGEPLRTEQATSLELSQMIGEIEEQCSMYKEYLDKGGEVFATESAYVSAILVEAGGFTPETGAIVLSTLGETLYFTGYITKEDKKYVSQGDLMTLVLGGRYLSDIPILALEEGEDSGYKVTAEISSQGRTIGENGNFSLVRKTDTYSECVPLAAIHSENQEDYVYYVENRETILGTELVAKRRKVKVLDKDEEFAALEAGTFTDEEMIILEADKEFQIGSRVREEE